MRSRFRTLAALLALLTLALFQAEAVWASMCAMDADAPARVAAAGPHQDGTCPMGGGDPPRERDGPDAPSHCPFVPAGQASCVGALALPASPDSAPELPGAGTLPISSSDHAMDLLLAASLLRPPRA